MSGRDARFQAINSDLEETQGLMQQNIQDMTRNIATAEELEGQTGDMVGHANDFRKASTDLKRTMWWKNMKLWLIIGGVVAVIVIVTIIIIIIIAKSGSN
ncbi:hypothetical protein ENUP19_0331G0002 [Entamoeba nuttalli]